MTTPPKGLREVQLECVKIKYPSKKHAEYKLKKIGKRRILSPSAYVYKCLNCDGWHLGHDKYYKEKNRFVEDNNTIND